MHTSRCAPDNNAANTLVDAAESSCTHEALGGLQARLDRVNGIKEQVYGCARKSTCLSVCSHATVVWRMGTRTTSD